MTKKIQALIPVRVHERDGTTSQDVVTVDGERIGQLVLHRCVEVDPNGGYWSLSDAVSGALLRNFFNKATATRYAKALEGVDVRAESERLWEGHGLTPEFKALIRRLDMEHCAFMFAKPESEPWHPVDMSTRKDAS